MSDPNWNSLDDLLDDLVRDTEECGDIAMDARMLQRRKHFHNKARALGIAQTLQAYADGLRTFAETMTDDE